MPDVRLVDLEVIRRYSLAVRQESADAAEILAVIESDREALRKALGRTRAPAARARGRGRTATTATRTKARSTAARRAR